MIEWSNNYNTGIAIIDTQHKELLELFNKLNDLCNDEFLIGKYDNIILALEEIKVHILNHFKTEEEYMLYIRYEKFFEHKLKHNYFTSKIESIDYDAIYNNQQNDLLELLQFGREWIINHISTVDNQLPINNNLYN